MTIDLISIIIPLYNKEKYIKQTIESIIKQTYTNWELIIIDDCSTDGSYKLAKKFENTKIKVIKNNKNIGPAFSRNIGLEQSKGRYICFQDADDLWDEQKLEKQLNFMKDKNCAFSYTGFAYIKEDGRYIKNVKIQPILRYEKALKDTRILTISVMFDLEKIDRNLLNMNDVKSEDIATWWNILKHGYVAYGLCESLVYYRQTKNSQTSNKFKSAKNRWKIYRVCERFSIIKSLYYFSFYAFFAIVKRI